MIMQDASEMVTQRVPSCRWVRPQAESHPSSPVALARPITIGMSAISTLRPQEPATTPMIPPQLRRVTVTSNSEDCFFVSLEDDVAAGGLFIATHMDWPVGMQMVAQVELPELKQKFRIRGVVHFVRPPSAETAEYPPGVGIRFAGLTEETRQIIERYSQDREPLFFDC
ncbi:MAG: hypothetical protein ACJAYU_004653 [Bradymonadia bacterium]|jgi:uncharacterized protein (TIGR02266 family)